MSAFGLFCIICGVIAALELIFCQWWDMKKDPSERLTLSNLLFGIFLVACPIVNCLVAVGLVIYILWEIAPKIILFGPRK